MTNLTHRDEILIYYEVVQGWILDKTSIPDSQITSIFIQFLIKKFQPMGQSHALTGYIICIILGQHFRTVHVQ